MASPIGPSTPARTESPAPKQKAEEINNPGLQAKPKDSELQAKPEDSEEVNAVAPPGNEQEAPRSPKDGESTISRVA
jgi:hypothetical protein